MARHVDLVQRDLPNLCLTRLDVRAQKHRGLVAAVRADGLQDLRVLVVGGVDARLLGEIEPANDADAVGHVAMHARHLGIAGGLDQRAMESLVPLRDLRGIGAALRGRHQPDPGQLGEHVAVDVAIGLTKAVRRCHFEHHPKVVQLLEAVEVEGQHAPAAAKQHLDETFLLQPEERLSHRRARDTQALADLAFGEAVAGHQVELGHVALELFVDLVRPAAKGSGVDREDGL